MTAKSIVRWPVRQVRGLAENAYALVADTSASDVLPASWISTLVWIRDSFPRSLGFASNPQEQLLNVVVFAVAMVVVSLTVLTYVAVPYALLFGALALARMVPAVDDRWPVSPQSWPLWTVQTSGANG